MYNFVSKDIPHFVLWKIDVNIIGEYLSGACCSATSHDDGSRQPLLGKRGIGDKCIADNPKSYVAKSDFSGIPISLVTA